MRCSFDLFLIHTAFSFNSTLMGRIRLKKTGDWKRQYWGLRLHAAKAHLRGQLFFFGFLAFLIGGDFAGFSDSLITSCITL
jgi:hypothetical protein